MREEQSEKRQSDGVHDVDEGVFGQHTRAVCVVRRGPGRRRVQVEVGAAEMKRIVTVTPEKVRGIKLRQVEFKFEFRLVQYVACNRKIFSLIT